MPFLELDGAQRGIVGGFEERRMGRGRKGRIVRSDWQGSGSSSTVPGKRKDAWDSGHGVMSSTGSSQWKGISFLKSSSRKMNSFLVYRGGPQIYAAFALRPTKVWSSEDQSSEFLNLHLTPPIVHQRAFFV
jgi:hypothetical protein